MSKVVANGFDEKLALKLVLKRAIAAFCGFRTGRDGTGRPQGNRPVTAALRG